MDNLGRLAFADIWLKTYPGDDAICRACQAAIECSQMQVVSFAGKDFAPQGVTRVWLLAESHFSVHTYPEHGYLSVDCYTCGSEGDPEAVIDALIEMLCADRVKRGAVIRGVS